MKTVIEEGVWDIEKKSPLRRVTLEYDGKKITRNLFILGDSEFKNRKVDVINLEETKITVNLNEVNKLSNSELGIFIKDKLKDLQGEPCFERNVNNEIEFFTNPIITRTVEKK